ncbi:MAG: hypothetical protein JSV59_13150 [Flavobacteriaceae bacterium]|nr:MAG: hypothetical protein JSV59_13150 [Flavobacteriaceae bacterium]
MKKIVASPGDSFAVPENSSCRKYNSSNAMQQVLFLDRTIINVVSLIRFQKNKAFANTKAYSAYP